MTQQERLKSILVVVSIVLIFLFSEAINVILGKGFQYLLSMVYPSFAFWISLILALIIEKKKVVNQRILIQTFILSILFLWALSLAFLFMHLPVTAFRDSFIFDLAGVYRILNIALFKAGWFSILMIILLFAIHKSAKVERK